MADDDWAANDSLMCLLLAPCPGEAPMQARVPATSLASPRPLQPRSGSCSQVPATSLASSRPCFPGAGPLHASIGSDILGGALPEPVPQATVPEILGQALPEPLRPSRPLSSCLAEWHDPNCIDVFCQGCSYPGCKNLQCWDLKCPGCKPAKLDLSFACPPPLLPPKRNMGPLRQPVQVHGPLSMPPTPLPELVAFPAVMPAQPLPAVLSTRAMVGTPTRPSERTMENGEPAAKMLCVRQPEGPMGQLLDKPVARPLSSMEPAAAKHPQDDAAPGINFFVAPARLAGLVAEHCCQHIEKLLKPGPFRFKIGMTIDPGKRWTNSRYGYLRSGDYSRMHVLAELTTMEGAAFLEALLIRQFASTSGCQNTAKGGEGMHLASSGPGFVYIVFKAL